MAPHNSDDDEDWAKDITVPGWLLAVFMILAALFFLIVFGLLSMLKMQ